MNIFKFSLVLLISIAITHTYAFANSVGTNNGQNSQITGNASSNLTVGEGQVFEASKRAYPIGQVTNFVGLPSYFGDASNSHHFIPLEKLLFYTTRWNSTVFNKMAEAKSMGKDVSLTPMTDKLPKEKWSTYIDCTMQYVDKEKFDVIQLAFGTIASTDKKNISSDLFGSTLREASKFGATHLQFLAEGVNRKISASSWGIGLNYTKATDSTISSGGTGYSTGESGYIDKPWLQFIVLKVVPREGVEVKNTWNGKTSLPEDHRDIEQQVDDAIKDNS